VLTDKTHGKYLAHGKFFETVMGRQFCRVLWAGTRQIQNFAVGFLVCRVPEPKHTAKYWRKKLNYHSQIFQEYIYFIWDLILTSGIF